ncbi:MAG: hypothetical protein NTX09_09210 [Verrucomicrobia bacterium]|nr:hypothetical protein [Verrucomicrobiota bacterium]
MNGSRFVEAKKTDHPLRVVVGMDPEELKGTAALPAEGLRT